MRPAYDPNLARSIMDKLKNEARMSGEAFNPLLTRYIGFRLLYRLSVSPAREAFVVKGATMFLHWMGALHRPTRDIDLLGTPSQDASQIHAVFGSICMIDYAQDGVAFDSESIRVRPIRDDDLYGGERVTLVGYLGNARVPLQIDVGFGDAITPLAIEIALPGIVDGIPPAILKGYPPETAIAEKVHAFCVRGLTNSRMKDFVDIVLLSDAMSFSRQTLADAIEATFKRRGTELPSSLPAALTEQFFGQESVQIRWNAFVRKNAIRPPFDDLPAVTHRLGQFLAPVLDDSRRADAGSGTWSAGGWQ